MKARNSLITIAAVAGVGLGSFGLASARSADQPAPPAVETDEAEQPGDEADDGIDHQFEGEEVGENGDGIPGPDEAAEEAAEGDEADDGVDHEFEGEEVGENGDGIPGPDEDAEGDDDASEVAEDNG